MKNMQKMKGSALEMAIVAVFVLAVMILGGIYMYQASRSSEATKPLEQEKSQTSKSEKSTSDTEQSEPTNF